MGIILKNHIALTSANHIKEICKPLEKLGITYFSFVRTYKDGSHIRLAMHLIQFEKEVSNYR